MKWPSVMIDIETLGTSDDAVILEIGATCFDRRTRRVGPRDSWLVDHLLQEGRRIDAETVRWWLKAENVGTFGDLTCAGHRPELWHGLAEFSAFLERHLAEGGEVWAKGDFDLRILSHAMRECGMEIPWKYWQARELRTVLKWVGVVQGKGVAHRALGDSAEQVRLLFQAETVLARAAMPEEELDLEGGWNAYREELAVTRAHLLPAWNDLQTDVREAWAAGAREMLKC